MNNTYTYDEQAKLFRVLMHPARLAILDVLRNGEACVCHIEAALGYRQAYISQQLSVLREANLIKDRRDGWNIYYGVIKNEVFNVIDTAQTISGNRKNRKIAKRLDNCSCPHCLPQKEPVAC